jgi:hypothetical protein
MKLNLSIAIDMIEKTINNFNPNEKFEIQLTNAEMIKEAAAIIANASEEDIIDTLKEKKRK